MEERIIDKEITLVPYFPNEETALPWYQDPGLCKQIDNEEHVYDAKLLKNMYEYLSENGKCYYIRFNGQLVGDITLQNSGEISIVVCKEYQNKHIGRRCVLNILDLARENKMEKVTANIYSFNDQSRRMFLSVGFKQTDEEWFEYVFK